MSKITYRVEIANKTCNGRIVANLFGVSRAVGGCRNAWVLAPQEDEEAARKLAQDLSLKGE